MVFWYGDNICVKFEYEGQGHRVENANFASWISVSPGIAFKAMNKVKVVPR